MLGLFTSKIVVTRRHEAAAIKETLAGRFDLSQRFSLPGTGAGDDLVEAINQIFKRLQTFVYDLTKHNVETATVAPQVQTIAAQVHQGAESLSLEVEHIQHTCNRLATSINTSTHSAGQALEQSARIVAEIDVTQTITNQALQKMQSMEQGVERLSGSINELDQRSKNIGSIIESISEIADHTGMLSLNASIEAARAGEHGAGFGVIAQEIRQLSQQTAQAAQEVKDSLLGISELIGQTVNAVSQVQEEVVSGLEGNREATTSLSQVSTEHRNFHTHLQSVIGAVEDQKTAVSQFGEDLGHISTIGRQGREESKQLTQLADQLKHLTDRQLLSTGIFILPQYRKAEKAVLALACEQAITTPGTQTDQVLLRQLSALSYLELLYLTDTQGIQVSSNVLRNQDSCQYDTLAKGKNWSGKEWFRNVRETGKPFISEIYKSEATDTFCLTIAVPVCSGTTFSGVLGADINFENLLKI